MFDIGYQELLIVAVIAIIVVGPKDLPGLLRKVGKVVAKARGMAGEFKSHFDEVADQEEFKEIRKSIESVKDLNPTNQIKNAISPFEDAGNSIQDSFNSIDSNSETPAIEEKPKKKKASAKPKKSSSTTKKVAAKKAPVNKKTPAKKPVTKKTTKKSEKAGA